VLLGLFEAGAFDTRDDKHPITRYMAGNISTRESVLEDNLERVELVKERAANYRLESSARQDTFKPSRSITYAIVCISILIGCSIFTGERRLVRHMVSQQDRHPT
jgi:hypothetical protein